MATGTNAQLDPSLFNKIWKDSPVFEFENAKQNMGKRLGILFTKAIATEMVNRQDFDINHYVTKHESRIEGSSFISEVWVEYIGDTDKND